MSLGLSGSLSLSGREDLRIEESHGGHGGVGLDESAGRGTRERTSGDSLKAGRAAEIGGGARQSVESCEKPPNELCVPKAETERNECESLRLSFCSYIRGKETHTHKARSRGHGPIEKPFEQTSTPCKILIHSPAKFRCALCFAIVVQPAMMSSRILPPRI